MAQKKKKNIKKLYKTALEWGNEDLIAWAFKPRLPNWNKWWLIRSAAAMVTAQLALIALGLPLVHTRPQGILKFAPESTYGDYYMQHTSLVFLEVHIQELHIP